jgi:hypothetical protein
MTQTSDNFFGRHKVRAGVVVFVGLVISLPAFLLSNFDKLVEGKTLPQWVAENGWWSRAGIKFVVIWLLASAALALIAYLSFAGVSMVIDRKKKSTLEISFHDRSPFVSDGKGNSGILYKQRRVSVATLVQGKVSLKVPELSIGSTNYPNVYLRPIQGQGEVLEAGETGYWYVIQMNSQDNSIKLVHIGNSEYKLGTQAQFEIVARCAGAIARKIVTTRIDEKKDLHFRLDDIGQAPALSDSSKTTDLLQSENAAEDSKGLSGRIICRDVALVLKADDHIYDCFLILLVKVTNDGSRTMASRWQLDLFWDGVEYPSVRHSVDGYFVKYPSSHADDPEIRLQPRPLTEFPNDQEITTANYKTGWLRFKVGAFPVEAIDPQWQRLRKEVVLKLQAFDSKDNSHLIYEGSTEELSGCGTIERPETLGRTS